MLNKILTVRERERERERQRRCRTVARENQKEEVRSKENTMMKKR